MPIISNHYCSVVDTCNGDNNRKIHSQKGYIKIAIIVVTFKIVVRMVADKGDYDDDGGDGDGV